MSRFFVQSLFLAFVAGFIVVYTIVRRSDAARKKAERKKASEPKKIYCKDCRYFRVRKVLQYGKIVGDDIEMCLVAIERHDPVTGLKLDPSNPRTKNRDFNCGDYTPHGAERIQSGSTEKKA